MFSHSSRILTMMHIIAANMEQNRMSISAVAACMAPLLLRPLLAGECELEQNNDLGGDGSIQLLQAATAANNAQAICITWLEEYDSLFEEGTMSSDLYSETEESGSESEELSSEGETSEDYSDDDVTDGSTDGDMEEDYDEHTCGSRDEVGVTVKCDERSGSSHSGSRSEDFNETLDDDKKKVPIVTSTNASEGGEQNKDNLNASCEQADFQSKPVQQANWNQQLLESLERWRTGLLDCRVTLEEDIPRLQEQLQKESELTTTLEAGLRESQGPRNISATCDEKTMEIFGEIARVELEIDNLTEKADDLRAKLNQQRELNFRLLHMKEPIKEYDLSSLCTKNKDHSLSDKAECVKEFGTGKPPSTNSRKSGAKGEGNNSTSVLSKLSNRFNFLNGQSGPRPAKGRSEGSHGLDRGKSESRATADKKQTTTTPRTFSR